MSLTHFIELILKRAKTTPNSIAVSYSYFDKDNASSDITYSIQLTFKQLISYSYCTSQYFKHTYNLHPNDIVIVNIKHSVEHILILLGLWFLNCTYVPVRIDEPSDRMQYYINTLNPRLIITSNENRVYSIPILYVPSYEQMIYESKYDIIDIDTIFANVILDLNSTACMISTSGTTGVPKLVMISFYAISHLINCMSEPLYNWTQNDIILRYANIAYGPHIREIIGGLCLCKQLVVLQSEGISDMDILVKTIQTYSVSRIYMTPSVFMILYTYLTSRSIKLKEITWFVFIGEATKWKHVKALQECCPNAQIGYNYSQTETMLHSFYFTLLPSLNLYLTKSQEDENIPIGISRKDCSIRFEDNRLIIRGAGLSHGYYNQQSDKFKIYNMPNDIEFDTGDILQEVDINTLPSFTQRDLFQQQIMYKFKCRSDLQIKLNGQLIEPLEIDQISKQIPEVKDTYLLKHELFGMSVLVIFIMSVSDSNTLRDKLISLWNQKLPSFMIPSISIILPSFPKNKNGKLDILKLRDIITSQSTLNIVDQPSLNKFNSDIIQKLYKDVSTLTIIPSLSISFKTLGFTSIMYMVLYNKIKIWFPNRLLLFSDIIQYNTITSLANYMESLTTCNETCISSLSTNKAVLFAGSAVITPYIGVSLFTKYDWIYNRYLNTDLFFQKQYGFSILYIIKENPTSIHINLTSDIYNNYKNILTQYKLNIDSLSTSELTFSNDNGLIYDICFEQLAVLLYGSSASDLWIKTTNNFSRDFIRCGFSLGNISSLLSCYQDLSVDCLNDWCHYIFKKAFASKMKVIQESTIYRFAYINLRSMLPSCLSNEVYLNSLIQKIKDKNLFINIIIYIVEDISYYVCGELDALYWLDFYFSNLIIDSTFDLDQNINKLDHTNPFSQIIPIQFSIPFHTSYFTWSQPICYNELLDILKTHPIDYNFLTNRYIPCIIGIPFEITQTFSDYVSSVLHIETYILTGITIYDGRELLARIISHISSSTMYWNKVIVNLFKIFNPTSVLEISPTNILSDLSQSVLRKHDPIQFKSVSFDYFNY
jgi:acyl-coenzyme A synthetase/AMP-(fatty) acid ligase